MSPEAAYKLDLQAAQLRELRLVEADLELANDGGVTGEEADDRVDVAIGIAFEVTRDHVGEVGGQVFS